MNECFISQISHHVIEPNICITRAIGDRKRPPWQADYAKLLL